MKKIKINLLLVLGISIFAYSCNDLGVKPVDNLTGDQVYTSEAGVNAAIQSMYMQLPIQNFNTSPYAHLNFNSPSTYIGVAQRVPLRVGGGQREINGSDYSWWNYSAIRYPNLGIRDLKANRSNFNDQPELYDHWLGEMYFCRAYMYYKMVRSFGGVPIAKTPASYLDYEDPQEMEIPRNTEKEVVDFIASDLDSAMALMRPNELERGRANRYIAANLKARVMLFAASEAKNGEVQLDGLVGIPSSDATEYYKKAYAAAQFAIDNEGRYELYRRYDDGTYMGKVKNYEQIFIDETANNKERMFVLPYEEGVSAHSWDHNQRPFGYTTSTDAAGELSANLEFVELFDDIDGNPGELKIGDPGNPVRYTNTEDLFAKAQPRLRATVLLPGVQFPGSNNPDDRYEIRKGIYESYPDGLLHTATNNEAQWNEMYITGKSGIGDIRTTDSGFIFWKYQNPDGTGSYWTSFQDWIEMRYAEVLLNKAEAAVNLIGETVNGEVVAMQDALEPINDIRERAGTTELSSVDLEEVKTQRRIELALENIVYWDMKRWRMLEEVAQNKSYSSLYPYYVADEEKYIFLEHETDVQHSFQPEAYYAPIPGSALQRNPNLRNNPGY